MQGDRVSCEGGAFVGPQVAAERLGGARSDDAKAIIFSAV
jgi:hypothetical protein